MHAKAKWWLLRYKKKKCVNPLPNLFIPFLNPFPSKWVLRALIDFTLSNARRFYSSMANLLDRKGLIIMHIQPKNWSAVSIRSPWKNLMFALSQFLGFLWYISLSSLFLFCFCSLVTCYMNTSLTVTFYLGYNLLQSSCQYQM